MHIILFLQEIIFCEDFVFITQICSLQVMRRFMICLYIALIRGVTRCECGQSTHRSIPCQQCPSSISIITIQAFQEKHWVLQVLYSYCLRVESTKMQQIRHRGMGGNMIRYEFGAIPRLTTNTLQDLLIRVRVNAAVLNMRPSCRTIMHQNLGKGDTAIAITAMENYWWKAKVRFCGFRDKFLDQCDKLSFLGTPPARYQFWKLLHHGLKMVSGHIFTSW